MAVATKATLRPRIAGKPASSGKEHTFRNLPLWTWKIRRDKYSEDGTKIEQSFEHQYVFITAPFAFIREWIVVKPFNSQDGSGWQREETESHVRNLRFAMETDDFTPAIWVASADEWHLEKLIEAETGPDEQEMVHLRVSEDHKLRLTDGNHRYGALKLLLRIAEKNNDQAMIENVNSTHCTIQVLLSPNSYLDDFMRLQRGKAVSRNQIQSMQLHTGHLDPEKAKHFKLATEIARILNKNVESHLLNQIAFDSIKIPGNTKLPIAYSSLMGDHASSLATTLYGGALIAANFGKDAHWMADRYVDVYQTIGKYMDDDNASILYMPKQKLSPANLGGKKGGSHLLLGIGNAFAWRMAFLDKESPSDEDLMRVREVAARKLDAVTTGGSAADKRRDMGLFAKAYFLDLKEKDPKSFPTIDGIPQDLVVTTSSSTWGVDNGIYKKWKKKNNVVTPPRLGPDGEPIKRGRKPKEVLSTEDEPEQVMDWSEAE